MNFFIIFCIIVLSSFFASPSYGLKYEKIKVDTFSSTFRDSLNRTRLFHGMNYVQKSPPYYPTIYKDDIENLINSGMNVVRLGCMMPGLFPTNSTPSEIYLKQINNISQLLFQHNIYTIIDLHQDVLAPKLCGEGTPDWMLNVSSLDAMVMPEPLAWHDKNFSYKHCHPLGWFKFLGWSEWYLTDAVGKAFQNIYHGKGLMSKMFDQYWRVVSNYFNDADSVLAYELMNEPWIGDYIQYPGLLLKAGAAEKLNVGLYMQRTHGIVREHDEHTPVLFSPAELNNRAFRRVGYEKGFLPGEPMAFHVYCAVGTDGDGTITTNRLENGEDANKNDNNSNSNSNNMTATNSNNNEKRNKNSRLRKSNEKIIRDIEELTKLGKEKDVCPYFLSRNGTVQKQADIFFMPYNYLVDPTVRSSLPDIDWQNAIVIIDEAHNLESVCTDSTSFELSAALISVCIKECDILILHLRDEMASIGGMTMSDEDLSAEDVATLRAVLLKIEEDVDNIVIPGNGEKGLTESGAFMYELLEKVNITWESKEALLGVLRCGINLFMGVRSNQKCHLETFLKAMNILFRNGLNPQIAREAYRTHLYYPAEYGNQRNNSKNKRSTSFFGGGNNNLNSANNRRRGKTIAFWCFSPGVAMIDIYKLGVRSIILTSGTLSPMDSVESELKLPFKIRLENSHVVSGKQVWVGTLKTGPTKKILNSSYSVRDTAEYKEELGRTILNCSRQIPNGMLIFFPSYSVMDRCVNFWKDNRGGYLWKQIEGRKDAFVEPRGSSAFNAVVRNFDAQAKTERGAMFFGVCRGKASEGIDFPDHCARGVIITGIPYAPHKNHQVELKRQYLDDNKKLGKTHLDGKTWYVQTALRAINQAIGRVIRHRFDYGAIFLCDERFGNGKNRAVINGLSKWLKPLCHHYNSFGEVVRAVSGFFRVARSTPEWNRRKNNKQASNPAKNGSSFNNIDDDNKHLLMDQNNHTNNTDETSLMHQEKDNFRSVTSTNSRIGSYKSSTMAPSNNFIDNIAASLAQYGANNSSSRLNNNMAVKSTLENVLAQTDQERREADTNSNLRQIGVFSRRSNSNNDGTSPLKQKGQKSSPENFLSKILEIRGENQNEKKRKLQTDNTSSDSSNRNSIKSKLARLRAPNNSSMATTAPVITTTTTAIMTSKKDNVAKKFLVDIKNVFEKSDFKQFRKNLKLLNEMKVIIRTKGKTEKHMATSKSVLNTIFLIFAKYSDRKKELVNKFFVFTPKFLRGHYSVLCTEYKCM